VIESIHPIPKIGSEIILSFVPVAMHPLKIINRKIELIRYTEDGKDKQMYYSQKF
jgi:hypothetical protein